MDASLQVQGSIHDGILIIQFWTGVQKTEYISLLLYNVAMNILQQIFSYHYEEIKEPLT